MKHLFSIFIFLSFMIISATPSHAGLIDWLFGSSVNGCMYNDFGEAVDCFSASCGDYEDCQRVESICLKELNKSGKVGYVQGCVAY